MKCGLCHREGHNATTCPKNPERTERIEIPVTTADVVMNRLRPVFRACVYDDNVLRAVMLSCYLQGAQDALYIAERHPELLADLPPKRAHLEGLG